MLHADLSAPDDHLRAGPDGGVASAVDHRVIRAHRRPAVGSRGVATAGAAAEATAPDDHQVARPDSLHREAGGGRVRGAGRRPRIRRRVVPAAAVQPGRPGRAAPDDHLLAGPDRALEPASLRRVDRAGRRPGIRDRVIAAAGVLRRLAIGRAGAAAPGDGFRAGPDQRAQRSRRAVDGAHGLPGIGHRVISAAGEAGARPDNHLAAGPDHQRQGAPLRLVDARRSFPAVGNWVVAAPFRRNNGAGVKGRIAATAPDDHHLTRPHRPMAGARADVSRDAGRRPGVGGRVVATAGIQVAGVGAARAAAPHYHLRARPDRRMLAPAHRIIQRIHLVPGVRGRVIHIALLGAAAAEDQHFGAAPHCRAVGVEGDGRGRSPAIVAALHRLPGDRDAGDGRQRVRIGGRGLRFRGKAPGVGRPPFVERAVRAGLAAVVEVAQQPVGQRRPGQTFGDQGRVVVQRRPHLRQHRRLLGGGGHAVHLRLQHLAGDCLSPQLLQGIGGAQRILHFGLDRGCRDHLVKGGLGAGVLRGPQPVVPVHFLNG